MKYLAFAFAVLLYMTPARAELMAVKLTIVKEGSGWKYVAIEGDERSLASDKELSDYLKALSNPQDGIWLSIESAGDVPVAQLIKVLTMVKANAQGIEVKSIDLDTDHFPLSKHGASTRPAG